MGARVKVSKTELRWLKRATKRNVPYTIMAARIGCHTDTLKRILMRHGLASFSSAKYQVSRTALDKRNRWRRPCLRCKCTRPRPRFQYICNACTRNPPDDYEWMLS